MFWCWGENTSRIQQNEVSTPFYLQDNHITSLARKVESVTLEKEDVGFPLHAIEELVAQYVGEFFDGEHDAQGDGLDSDDQTDSESESDDSDSDSDSDSSSSDSSHNDGPKITEVAEDDGDAASSPNLT